MGILRADRVAGLGGANAINGSVNFGSSLLYSGRSNLTVTPNSELDIGAGNFTIEYWFNCENTSSGEYSTSVATSEYNGSSSNTAFTIYHYVQGFRIFNRISGGYTSIFNTSSSWTASKWHHFAWVREGTGSNENKIYVDGTLSGSAFTNAANYTAGQHWLIGSNFNGGFGSPEYGFSGYLSNVRVSNTARYTANFTVPTTRLEKDTNTILLACQSPGNILKEETGKIITVYNSNINNSPPQASHFAPDVGEDHGTTFEDNTKFDTLSYMVPPGGTTAERGRGRGLVGGGFTPGVSDQIYSVEIASDGTSSDFGNLSMSRRGTAAVSSSTRAVWAGGYAPGYQDRIDYVNISAGGKAIDFGNLDHGRFESSGVSNGTRGVYGPSENPAQAQNVIQYITIASAGNATDFGDSSISTGTKKQASMNSTTRGLFAGGQNVPSPSAFYDIIDYITIASTGNATDFGDLTENVFMCTGVSDATRGVRGGGNTSPTGSNTNTIDYITIASAGNATNFGDLITANQRSGGMSNSIRGLFSGGATPNSNTFVSDIAKITIQTTGDATDFGDYIGTKASQGAGCSDSHGGIS